MRSVLIRRFEISDQLTHLFNALFWAVLAATGILIGSASRANDEPTHLSIGVHFAFGFALAVLLSAYILFAKSRFQRMLFEIFRTDRPFLAWLKCLGGYPSKILNRPQKSSSVPPQGRYNAGQRRSYFSEYSFARFRFCFVRTAPTAGGTEQCLPIGVMRPFWRFRSCLFAACSTYSDGVFVKTVTQSHVESGQRLFDRTGSHEARRPLGEGRFGNREKRL